MECGYRLVNEAMMGELDCQSQILFLLYLYIRQYEFVVDSTQRDFN